jgi:serine/threonine protein kinase
MAAGARLGPYEIVAPIGAGGMGEVYKARDTRLERTVAVKVLSPLLADSPESRQRFEREARAISQLSHPHICALFDVGRDGDTEYLVMEYLEGETLADRLKKGPLPLPQTFEYGGQIADALDKAHRQGIVHRDLKPGNVMLTKTGVKLLDFGLAKVFRPPGAEGLVSAPSSSGLTQQGMIIGTIQYMAPEQLEGKKTDGRTDIFALGAVLYEMTSGRKAFTGDSHASLIVAIMHVDPPPLSHAAAAVPAPLDRVIRKCLAKDPDQRWQSAHDVASELEWLSGSESETVATPSAARRRTARSRWKWSVSALALASAFALGWLALRRPAALPARRVFPLLTSPGEVQSVAVSPDGRKIAFTTGEFSSEGGIWIRSIDSLESTRLSGTEGAADPFWSPDGRYLGFFAGGKLRRITVEGGAQQTLADAERYGGSWSAQGTILYAPIFGQPLRRVSASGGASEPVTTLDAARGEVLHCWPVFLPDGQHFLFFARAIDPAKSAIWLGHLGSPERTLVASADGGPVWVDPSYVLFSREGVLLGQRFPPSSRTLSGEPVPLARKVGVDPSNNDLQASASAQLLVYVAGGPKNRQLTWLDRAGRPAGTIGSPAEYWTFTLSPDEKQIAASIADPDRRTGNLWLIDTTRGTRTRLTSRPTDEFNPRWSRDGFLYYTSDPDGFYDLFRTPAAGGGSEEKVLQSGIDKFLNDVSADGKDLLFTSSDLKTGYDVGTLAVGPAAQPQALFQANFPETDGQFSPDGRWIVYVSRESGREEVFAAPRAAPARRQQVSVDGGGQPRWSKDGREIFFISRNRQLMAAPVRPVGGALQISEPSPLFASKDFQLGWDLRARTTYEVSSDGRFLFAVPVDEPDARPVVAVVDWAAPLAR